MDCLCFCVRETTLCMITLYTNTTLPSSDSPQLKDLGVFEKGKTNKSHFRPLPVLFWRMGCVLSDVSIACCITLLICPLTVVVAGTISVGRGMQQKMRLTLIGHVCRQQGPFQLKENLIFGLRFGLISVTYHVRQARDYNFGLNEPRGVNCFMLLSINKITALL